MKIGEFRLITSLSQILILSLIFVNNAFAGIATGTGFFVSQNGYLVTCFHVIEGAKGIAVRDSSGKIYQASVVRTDSNNDIALLKVNGRFNSLAIANSGVARRGAEVITVGFPHIDVQGAEPKVTDGIINSLTGIADDPRHFQISVPVQSGNSGGALVSMSGNVIGVVSSKLSALKMLKSTGDLPQNVNYAIKSNYLLELVSTISGLKSQLKEPFSATRRNLSDLTEQVEKATVLIIVETEQIDSAVESQPKAKSGSLSFLPPKSTLSGEVFKDCANCPEMVLIPAGSFDMGSNNGDADEKPVHRVIISLSFAMGKTEVTQGQWRAVMGNNPSYFGNCGDDCPVEQVSWDDAKAFIKRLNTKTGKQYRLPSEAEWEYACRAGGRHEYCGSDNENSVAWIFVNSGSSTHMVSRKQANAFGLYDMSGNVWEWVEDQKHDSYVGAPSDYSVWYGDGTERVLRGGSWLSELKGSRAANRYRFGNADRPNFIGFRLVRVLP